MINMISRSIESKRTTGPQKVAVNLVKALERIGYAYVVNRDVSATRRLWIHDDPAALEYAHLSAAHVLVGPKPYVLPRDAPQHVNLDGMLYVHPGPDGAHLPGTAAPFFDEQCGLRIDDLREFPHALERMQDGLGGFRPRDYVVENLSLEKQAREFVALWDRWGLDEESGRREVLQNERPLSEPWQHAVVSAPRRASGWTSRRLRGIGRRLRTATSRPSPSDT